ncbi:MAG: hypothetical protein ABSC77_11155 [Terracidiphilus sp.]|jgi:hypothetical protein
MKILSVIFQTSVLILGLSVYATAQQQDWKTVVNHKLSGYALTKVPFDKTTVESSGSKFTLKQDGLALLATSPGRRALFTQSNIYVKGVVQPEFPSLLKSKVEAGTARIFSAGEKVWLTRASFTGRGDGLELELVSDLIDGTRYWGTLKFLAPKGTQPDGEAISAAISEVLELEDTSSGGFCRALVKLTSTIPNDMISTTILPGASLLPKDSDIRSNDWEHHTEQLILPGDQATPILKQIGACLPKYTSAQGIIKTEHGWGSTLRSTDPPYDIVLVSTAVPSAGHTVVIVTFQRSEDPTKQKLDFAKIAYVRTASATCGWEMAPEQIQSLDRFTGAWINEEIGAANRHIDAVGRLDFCDDPKEKAKYDRLIPSIYPRGLVGKP